MSRPLLRDRRTTDLRKGRISLPGARYFVTCCAIRPTDVLTTPSVSQVIHMALDRLVSDGDMGLLCATIMPDHVHLLFSLGTRLTVSRMVGKLKALTSAAVQAGGGQWQRNFFEHRLRPNDLQDGFGRYIFMNPYAAELIRRRAEWPHWIEADAGRLAFRALLDEGRYPPVEWMGMTAEAFGLTEDEVGPD